MTIDEQIAVLETKLARLKRIADKRPGVWFPKPGDTIYSLSKIGDIECRYKTPHDYLAAAQDMIGNLFPDRSAAIFAYERLRVLAEMRRYAKGFQPDWSDKNQDKYILNIYPNVQGEREITVEQFTTWNIGAPVYFATSKDAITCVEAIGEERLMRYYFCEEPETES